MKTLLTFLMMPLMMVASVPVFAQEAVEAQPDTEAEQAPAEKEVEPSYTVDSQNGLKFDSERDLVTYFEDVVFKYPEQGLTVTCDKLEVVRNPKAGEVGPDGEPESDLKSATAIGNVVIVKVDESGKKKIGRSGRAVFDTATSDVVMTEMPTLLENNNLIKAKSPDTVFVLKENGQHDLQGPVSTEFVSNEESE